MSTAVSSAAFGMDDPISLALRPPPRETASQRVERLKSEAEKKKISDEIDKRLKDDAQRMKKEKAGEHKILLLGQAAAGKTTVLKQMRLLYDKDAHNRDRESWRTVIQLNVIAAVRTLVECIEAAELADQLEDNDSTQVVGEKRYQQESTGASVSSPPVNNRGLLARLRFAPLLSLEPVIRRRLGAVGEADDLSKVPGAGPGTWSIARSEPSSPTGRVSSTVLLKAGWQERLMERMRFSSDNSDSRSVHSLTGSTTGSIKGFIERKRSSPMLKKAAQDQAASHCASSEGLDHGCQTRTSKAEDPSHMLLATRDEIKKMWNDPLVRRLRRRGKLDIVDSAAYFIDHIDRISDLAYQPTDDDILHARVRTVGITDDRFQIDKNTAYRIYDVGGSRNQRSFWAPYFDDAQAIIFLAPISAFDQKLIEDPSVNRVEDSMQLFSQIIENPLLRDVSLVLFLNKIDVLEKKLRQGILVSDHFPEYEGENEFEEVWRWFRSRFRKIVTSKRSVAPQRPIYVHTTVATSTKQIKNILASVNDAILRNNLKTTGLSY
ncbi:guanine nucleotide binding protein, alpha subunit [Violaceomyces palustris]|uniref:Guanine nucleotide binding protein, alpha subunit n=1 Tax=Violaceomyces palustris TaxID=1673888 RepID=A0ACD0NLH6_9BASI|nr:guanine nucleotide binding protein, alpha subunit [Violaceomyces palustris]